MDLNIVDSLWGRVMAGCAQCLQLFCRYVGAYCPLASLACNGDTVTPVMYVVYAVLPLYRDGRKLTRCLPNTSETRRVKGRRNGQDG